MVISCVIAIIWQLTWIIMIHLVINKVGMVYTEAEVLRQGNDQTLDNLDEGVVILDEKEMKIRYYNKAASVSQKNLGATEDEIEAKPDYTSFVQ